MLDQRQHSMKLITMALGLLSVLAPGPSRGTEVWFQTQKELGSDTESGDIFGSGIGIDGDIAVVGAPFEDSAGNTAGAAYVFERDLVGSGRWSEAKKLTGSEATAGGAFGFYVAISGTTIAVGAPQNFGGGNGEVYVFERDLGGMGAWGERVRLVADEVEAQVFGFSVAIDGDTLVVSDPTNDSQGVNAGAIFIFERNLGGPDTWGLRAKRVPAAADAGDRFGISVAIDGDTIIAGSSGGINGAQSGVATVFERNLGGADAWGERKSLTPSDGFAIDLFAEPVGIEGDTILVGARNALSGGEEIGAVYVFDRNFGGADFWGERAKLVASDGEPGDFLGDAVGISGSTVVVGAAAAADDTGAAYLFERDLGGTNAWGEREKVVAFDAQPDQGFGRWLAISGRTIMIGSYLADTDAGDDSGAAYYLEKRTVLFNDDFESADCSAWDQIFGGC